MTPTVTSPVLMLGGTGMVGSRASRILRQLYPDLPIAVAARDQSRCRALTAEIGNAEATTVDLERADLGLAPGASYAAVVAMVKENTLNPLRFAQSKGLPYLSMADGAFEIGPAVARYVHRPLSAATMLASHWAAGMATLPALHFTSEFRNVHAIEIAVLMDPDEPLGRMAAEDLDQVMQNSPRPLVLDQGTWRWVGEGVAARRVKNTAGVEVEAHAITVLDTVSLAAATDARVVRFDFGIAQSASRRRGGVPSQEMIIEIEGERKDGARARLRVDIEYPQGVAGLTALGVVLSVERLLGLVGGPPVAPGLYFPENLIAPVHAIGRLKEFGGQVLEASPR
ncbi:MAG TPA: NAD(P)-dependent oxidoreductase [Myxococcaceae bacterium]|nr:NAD(P)-dependent oxidoreductase [Myxococcaceae bacterium]